MIEPSDVMPNLPPDRPGPGDRVADLVLKLLAWGGNEAKVPANRAALRAFVRGLVGRAQHCPAEQVAKLIVANIGAAVHSAATAIFDQLTVEALERLEEEVKRER